MRKPKVGISTVKAKSFESKCTICYLVLRRSVILWMVKVNASCCVAVAVWPSYPYHDLESSFVSLFVKESVKLLLVSALLPFSISKMYRVLSANK